MQTLDDADGGGERVVVKSPGGAIRVEVSSATGDVSVFYDGSPEPLVRHCRRRTCPAMCGHNCGAEASRLRHGLRSY